MDHSESGFAGGGNRKVDSGRMSTRLFSAELVNGIHCSHCIDWQLASPQDPNNNNGDPLVSASPQERLGLSREFTQLTCLLNGGTRTDFENTLLERLRSPIFADAEGLTLEEQAAISYSR